MTATYAASEAIVKRQYEKGVPKAYFTKFGLLDDMKKITNWKGGPMERPIQNTSPQGASHDYPSAVANVRMSSYKKYVVEQAEDYAIARVKGSALQRVSTPGAIIDMWKNEISSVQETAVASAAYGAWTRGDGVRAYGTASGSTFTLGTSAPYDAYSINQLELGMSVQFASSVANALAGTLADGGMSFPITAIDREAGTFQGSTTLSSLVSSLASGNWYVLRTGDGGGADFTGLRALMNGGPTTVHGLDRSSDPVRLSGTAYTATSKTIVQALSEMEMKALIQGGSPNVVYMHPSRIAMLKQSKETSVQFNQPGSNGKGSTSFNQIIFYADSGGQIELRSDVMCPATVAWMGEKGEYAFGSTNSIAQILADDGQPFLRTPGDNSYEVRIGTYGNPLPPKTFNSCVIASGFGVP